MGFEATRVEKFYLVGLVYEDTEALGRVQ